MKSEATSSNTSVFLGIASFLSFLVIISSGLITGLPYNRLTMFFYFVQCNIILFLFGFITFIFYTILQMMFNYPEKGGVVTMYAETDFFYKFVDYFGINFIVTFLFCIFLVLMDFFFFEIIHIKTLFWYLLIFLYSLIIPLICLYFLGKSYNEASY